MTEIRLATDGPHSPGYTKQVAEAVAEAIRVLTHATGNHASEALEYPADVDAVVESLTTAVQRLPQLLTQLGRWLGEQEAAGRLAVNHGPYASEPHLAVVAVKSQLTLAGAVAADRLYQTLHEARQVTATISSRDREG